MRTKEEIDNLLSGFKESILEFVVPFDEALILDDFEGIVIFTDRTVTVTQVPDTKEQAK